MASSLIDNNAVHRNQREDQDQVEPGGERGGAVAHRLATFHAVNLHVGGKHRIDIAAAVNCCRERCRFPRARSMSQILESSKCVVQT